VKRCPICAEWKYRQLVTVCPICGRPGGEQEVEDLATEFLKTLEGCEVCNSPEGRVEPRPVLFCNWPELYISIHS
jgi:hypothetical protein